MNQHEKFELLCTLAVIGQIRDADLRELKRHVEECVDCQNRISDFAQISAQALLALGDEYGKPSSPQAMTARFVERARAEGIPLRGLAAMFPSRLSFGWPGWNGALAAALLLIVITTAGISHSFHLRARSVVRGRTAEIRLPDEGSIHRNAVEDRSESRNARFFHVRARMQSTRDPSSSAGSPRRLNSGRRDRAENPRQSLAGLKCSDHHYDPRMLLNGEVFASGVQTRPPELFPACGNSAPALLTRQLRLPWIQHSPFVDKAQYAGTNSQDRLIMASSLSPDPTLRADHFETERVLRTGFNRSPSDSKLDIDWCAMSKCTPRTWAPAWPFSNDGKVEQP